MSQQPTNPLAYSLTLPVEPDQLGLFISGLLGKPQTISRLISGPFEVKRTDIENLHHLIEQRLASQNQATLVGFTAKIIYDDASSILLNSFLQFQTYNEIKSLASAAIHLTWTHLIQFNNKPVPEKQQIELSIMANGYDNTLEIDREIGQRFAVTKVIGGLMQLRISHTDRTWGADMDALLTGYLQQLRTRLSAAEQVAENWAGWIGFATGLGLFLILMWGLIYTSAQVHAKYAPSASALTADIRALATRIDDLSNLIVSGVGSQYTIVQVVFCIVSIIASIAAAIFVGSLASQTRRSALIITRKDAETHVITAARANRGFLHFLLSAPAALVLGVIGNGLFYLLTRFLAH